MVAPLSSYFHPLARCLLRPMKIAFNAQRLAGQRLGVGRYIEYMVRHWVGLLEAEDELSLFLRRPLLNFSIPLNNRVQAVTLDSRLVGVPWENLRLRRAAASHDVLFCPAYSAPVAFPRPTVVAVHSVTEFEPGLDSWWYRQTYSRLYAHCARAAAGVIVPSEVTKETVVERYHVPRDRVAVIPQGADNIFRPGTPPDVLRAVRQRFFGGDRPYILFVGKCSPRRNIPRLIEAFAELKAREHIPHGLLLFGPNHLGLPLSDICHRLGVHNDVVQTDGTVQEHADLVPIYSAADLFVHPSENEGWSMTTVEAMACGTPVVAMDRGGLAEVARGHALMIQEASIATLAEAMGKVILDREMHKQLGSAARARGAALNWSSITRATLEVVRNAAKGLPVTTT